MQQRYIAFEIRKALFHEELSITSHSDGINITFDNCALLVKAHACSTNNIINNITNTSSTNSNSDGKGAGS